MAVDVELIDGVHVVSMRAGDNAFDLSFARALQAAMAAGPVDDTAAGGELLRCAIERAGQFRDKDGHTLGRLRATTYAEAVAALTGGVALP